jgi:hypothetical protein
VNACWLHYAKAARLPCRLGRSTAEFLVKRSWGLIAVQGHFARLDPLDDARPFSGPPGASGCRVGLVQLADRRLDSEGHALDCVLRPHPLVRHTTESREDEVAVTDPVEHRAAAAQQPQSAPQWRHLYLLQCSAALAERVGYGALQVAVQRVAAREAWLTWPERRG